MEELETLMDEASRALREGRVAELVERANRAAELIEASGHEGRNGASSSKQPYGTLALRVAALLQAAFRFSGMETPHTRGLAMCARIADDLDRPSQAVQARAVMATFHVVSGRFRAMMEASNAAIDLAAATGLAEDPMVAMAHQFRGYALFEWNRLDEARAALDTAWRLAPADSRGVRSGTARMLASVHAAGGDHETAAIWLDRLEQVVGGASTMRNREWLAAVRIAAGDDATVRSIDDWAHGYDYPLGPDARPTREEAASRLHEYEHLLTVLEATRQWEPMLHVADAMEIGAGTTRRWFAARAPAARAVALEGLGRTSEAAEAWAVALGRGRADGYVRIYLAGSPPRARLLERARAVSATRADAERVLDAARTPGAADDDVLTPRQLEALRLVGSGRSNRAIAEEMGVSTATVKTHLRDVYARLEVGSRTEALARARRMGIAVDPDR